MATLLFSQKKDQTRQVQNQSKQTKQTNPDSSVCSLDLPLDWIPATVSRQYLLRQIEDTCLVLPPYFHFKLEINDYFTFYLE
jgi:hypothetical protein